jgi:hypothetical protein
LRRTIGRSEADPDARQLTDIDTEPTPILAWRETRNDPSQRVAGRSLRDRGDKRMTPKRILGLK